MSSCCVNLSGSSCPVYDWNNNKIGDIMNREFFTLIGSEGSLHAIYFMGPSGAMLEGRLSNPWAGVLTGITERPHSHFDLNGYRYKAFMMRNTMNLYNMVGDVVGSVAAGKRVLCKTSMAGDTQYYLKAINYVEKRAGGWDTMADGTGAYGFVDTGMRNGTSAGSISLYGNW